MIVIEFEPGPEGIGVLHAQVQDAFASGVSGLQLGIDPLDTRILLEQKNPFLEADDIDGSLRSASHPVPQIRTPEPAIPLHIDARQRAFDHLNGNEVAS